MGRSARPAWPPDTAVVFCLRIAQADFIEWDTSAGAEQPDRDG